MKNYYEILEVNKKASKEVIEKAYKVLVKKYHPDLYTGEKHQYAEKRTKEINEAYHILSDEFLKEQYDNELEKQELLAKKKANNYQVQNKKDEEQYRQDVKQGKTKKPKVGTLNSTIELTKQLINDIIKSKEKREEIKEITKKDILAVILTIIVVILIGIMLWFIPFTNGWMQELLFENPLFNWIGSLFS